MDAPKIATIGNFFSAFYYIIVDAQIAKVQILNLNDDGTATVKPVEEQFARLLKAKNGSTTANVSLEKVHETAQQLTDNFGAEQTADLTNFNQSISDLGL